MMFTIAALFLAALPALAAATPVLESRGNGGTSSCSTGDMQCCNSVQSASSPEVQDVAGALDIPTSSLTGEAGLQCTPISVIGVAGQNNCHAQAVCCTNNSYGSLISLGCVPIST